MTSTCIEIIKGTVDFKEKSYFSVENQQLPPRTGFMALIEAVEANNGSYFATLG